MAHPKIDVMLILFAGTTTVLRSAATVKSLKRVVLTSSTAAVRAIGDSPSNGVAFTEADWNDAASLESAPYPFSKVYPSQSLAALIWRNFNIDLHEIIPIP
jgi:nucleoside-diphosphate-sugar epimerase